MRRTLLLLSTAAALSVFGGAAAAHAAVGIAPARATYVPRQIVVKLAGERTGRAIGVPRGASVAQTAEALRKNPRVVYAEPNYIATASARRVTTHELPDDTGSLEGTGEVPLSPGSWVFKQWNFLPPEGSPVTEIPTSPGGIDVTGAWQHMAELGNPGGAGVLVAVLDTGVAYRNVGTAFRRSPDFLGRRKFAQGADFVDHDHLPLDENGHGTHVAGTIAESTGNRLGLTGIAFRARILPVRVLDSQGRGNAVAIAKGIEYAISRHANVINMSFNFECGERVPIVNQALARAHKAGIVLVASAGNLSAEACVSAPATAPSVIAVGATTAGGCLADYSPSGTAIDILAPGGGESVPGCPSVLSYPIYQVTLKHDTTNEFAIPSTYTGTSMAAAHVSGVAALLMAIEKKSTRKLTVRQRLNNVTRKMMRTARSLGLPRTEQGAGLINAARATSVLGKTSTRSG